MERQNNSGTSSDEEREKLPCRTVFSYGVGHVLNDLCASMWFTYLLVFLQKIARFSQFHAGILLMIGQVADAVATPIVGIESDRTGNIKYGKRKIWHLGGCIAVCLSFPFIFNLCLFKCAAAPEWSLFFYYAPFIVMFQFGWASTQISHLALIPDLASDKKGKVELNAVRYGFTVSANIFVYVVCWMLFTVDSSPGKLTRQDAVKFKYLVLIVVGVGALFMIVFHLGVKESGQQRHPEVINSETTTLMCPKTKCLIRIKSTWKSWFTELQFYQIGGVYMSTRLVVNISQVYIPMYVTDTLLLDKRTIAIVPLIVYVSGIVATAVAKPFSSCFGLKITYVLGVFCVIGACVWFWFLDTLSMEYKHMVYPAACFLGFGSSTLLIAALAMTADLIGDNTETGAFVYGAMSFLDKLSNGLAVLVIQRLYPCHTVGKCCGLCEEFYRRVMSFVPGGAAVLGLIFLLTLVRTKIGVFACKSFQRSARSDGTYGAVRDSLTYVPISNESFTDDEDQDERGKNLSAATASIQGKAISPTLPIV